jgi:hypothetical protein
MKVKTDQNKSIDETTPKNTSRYKKHPNDKLFTSASTTPLRVSSAFAMVVLSSTREVEEKQKGRSKQNNFSFTSAVFLD